MGAKLATDQNYSTIPAPTLRKIILSGSSYTPEEDVIAILGADTTITIDGNSIELLKGFAFAMCKGVTYEFSASVALGLS